MSWVILFRAFSAKKKNVYTCRPIRSEIQTIEVIPGLLPLDEINQNIIYKLEPLPDSITWAEISLDEKTGKISISSVNNEKGNQIFSIIADDGQKENNLFSQNFNLIIDQPYRIVVDLNFDGALP